jgi:1,4-dihydroxy-2-naphthoyl-CoA hydrolase
VLPEEPVGDAAAVVGRHAGRGDEAGEPVVRALAYGGGVEAQRPGDGVVGPALAQHELQDRALVGGQGVEAGHAAAQGTRGATLWCRTLMESSPAIPVERTFDALYGLEVLERSEELVRAQVAVRDEVRQPMGLVHGGVFASMAESMTSLATAMAVAGDGRTAQGLSNQTSFLRPILAGTVHATARRRHRGRTTWVWEVEITDDDDRLCALVRMTIAVR